MTDSAEKFASLVPGLSVSEEGDTIVVRVPSGVYTGRIPTTWEGRPIRIYTTPCQPAGPILKASACLLMAVMVAIVLAGIASLIVVLLVRWQ